MKFKVNDEKFVKIMQEGGVAPEAAPAEAPAEPEQAGGSPEEQIIQAAAQAVQTQDAQLALQVCQALVEMAGGGAEAAPAAPEGQQPVYRKGGRLSRWISK